MADEPTTPPADPGDNAAIRAMREQIKTLEADARRAKDLETQLSEAQSKLTEIERAKLEENERLKLDLADARKAKEETEAAAAQLRDENGRYQSSFQSQYEAELASVDEEKRSTVEELSKTGTWADRYEAIKRAKALIPAQPAQGGTVTRPGTTPATTTAAVPKPYDPNLGWGDALKRPANRS